MLLKVRGKRCRLFSLHKAQNGSPDILRECSNSIVKWSWLHIEVLIRDQMAAGGGKWTEAAGNIIK